MHNDQIGQALSFILLPQRRIHALLAWLLSPHPAAPFAEWLVGSDISGNDGRDELPAPRDLFPLMSYVIREHRLAAPDHVTDVLRAGEIHETFRCARYIDASNDILSAASMAADKLLYLSGIPAGRVFPRPDLRHHNECVVATRNADEAQAVVAALVKAHCTHLTTPRRGTAPRIRLRHPSGVVAAIQPFFLPFDGNAQVMFDAVYARATPWAAGNVRALSDHDALVEILGRQAFDPTRYGAMWWVDAMFQRNALDKEGIKAVCERAPALGLARIARVIFAYLDTIATNPASDTAPARMDTQVTFAERLLAHYDFFQYGRARWLRTPNRIFSPLAKHALKPQADIAAWSRHLVEQTAVTTAPTRRASR